MIALTLALFAGASLAAFLLAVARAPVGYEDATGFHFGDAPRGHDGRAPGAGSKSFHGEVK